MTWKKNETQTDKTGFLPPKGNKKEVPVFVVIVPVIVLSAVLFSALVYFNRCGEKKKIRVNNISQVLIHQPHEYTLIVEGAAAVTVYGDPVITYDVSPEEKSWAQFTTDPAGRTACRQALAGTLEFHLHPKQEAQGANWEKCYHTSHGGTHCESGTTTMIE